VTTLAPPEPAAAAEATDAPGLRTEQARLELERVGPNVLAEAERPRWLLRFARNFTHLFALLLWAGAGLALLGGQPPLAIAIVVVIVVSAIFSFAQEYRAERAVEVQPGRDPGVVPGGLRRAARPAA
jgi:magnesium-transporting ATPase (P-type)